MKKVLIIAYHYPPVKVSSAVQRTLKFSQYLLDEGWHPIILTVKPMAAISQSNEQVSEIPDEILVKRSFAIDTVKHLSIKGRYFDWMALPDRWVSWIPFGIIQGLSLIKQHKPDIIISTYPIASAHCIAYGLNKITHIPWVADFRDSMTDDIFPPPGSARRKFFQYLEKKFVHSCNKALFTTTGTLDMYASRFPHIPKSRWTVIPNGYDEENFLHAANKKIPIQNDKTTIIHSGVIYPVERDPTQFFSAISQLKQKGQLSSDDLCIILRATGHDKKLSKMIENNNIKDIVLLKPTIAYEDALSEMLEADGLLILQADNCNHQIPAKIYEYMRAQKPILALTDKSGNTAQLLMQEEIGYIIPLDNTKAIKEGLLQFIDQIRNREIKIMPLSQITKFSRKSRTKELAQTLNQIS